MSAKIKLNAASGGGSVSIQAPSSSSNNRVITLPDIADGTLLTNQSSGLGQIRQHKIISKNDQSSIASQTPTAIPSFSITITPTASDSIMVVEANVFYSISSNVICTRIYNGTSFLISPSSFPTNNYQNGSSAAYNAGQFMYQQHITAFETSGNTNARTYNVYWCTTGGTGYINRWHGTQEYYEVSTLRVMEVAP